MEFYAKMQMMEYKHQHYINRSYLLGFSDNSAEANSSEGNVWVYDRISALCYRKSVAKVAKRSHYYSFIIGEKYDAWLEKFFGQIENPGVKAIRTIEKEVYRYMRNETFDITPEVHHRIVDFAYIHFIRVPARVDELRIRAEEYEEQISSEFNISPSKSRSNNAALTILVRFMKSEDYPIYELFLRRNFYILYTRQSVSSYLTSDNPVVRFRKNGPNGLAYPETEIWFPITSSILVAFMSPGIFNPHIEHFNDPLEVDRTNAYIAMKSTRYLFANSSSILEKIVRMNGWTFTMKPAKDGA
jgi:hypothetical protein